MAEQPEGGECRSDGPSSTSPAIDEESELYERAPFGYLLTGPDGTIRKANRTFLSLTGFASDELIGRRFRDLLNAGGRIYHETHYAPLLEMQDEVHEIAFEIVCADGTRLPALVNSVLQRDEDRKPVAIRVAVFDATERRRYERDLVRAKESAEESERRATLLARTLQRTLLPPVPPEIPGLDVAARYRPAFSGDEVGGDFYDVFEAAADDWIVVIGDVQGKGVAAASVTTHARYSIRAAAVRQHSPSTILATLNQVLIGDATDRFCTIALLRLRRSGAVWRVTVCCAGHPLPILRRSGEEPKLLARPGSLLGIYPSPDLHDSEIELEQGDLVLVYTDGVTEGRQGQEFYGERRLRAALTTGGNSASEVVDSILDGVLAFQHDNPRDDIALLALRCP